jgi:hypothetical protein
VVNNGNKGPEQALVRPAEPQRTAAPLSGQNRSERSTAAKAPVATSPDASGPTPAGEEDVAEALRSGNVAGNLTLKEVKKIYVEIRGGAAVNELRSNLVDGLGASGVVGATTNADEADAALKISVSQISAGNLEASAQLVNARGTVLWRGARRYSGETTTMVSEIVKDLLAEIRRARSGH